MDVDEPGELVMKGVVFDVAHDIVCEQYSVTTWDQILVEAGVDGAYASLGNYPADELDAIVGAAARLLGRSNDEILGWLGASAFARLAALIPDTIGSLSTWEDLLESLDHIVHAEVTRVYPDAAVPSFDASRNDGRAILLHYRSHRNLCAFAGGLIEGAGAWYGATLDVQHLECTNRGDARCVMQVTETATTP